MKKLVRILINVVALISFGNLTAQSWSWANGMNNAFDNSLYSFMDTDEMGNSYYLYRYSLDGYYGDEELIIGEFQGMKYYLVKHDPSGAVVWSKIIDGGNEVVVNGFNIGDMEVSSVGEIYLNGFAMTFGFVPSEFGFTIDDVSLPFYSSIITQGFLYKLDTDGVAIWGKPMEESVVPGFSTNLGSCKLRLSNDELKLYVAGPHTKDSLFIGDVGVKLSETSNIFGTTSFFIGQVNSADGLLSWADGGYGGDANNLVADFEVNTDDELFVDVQWSGDTCFVGPFEIPNPDNQGGFSPDNLIAKFSSEGSPVWADNIGSSESDNSSIALTNDGGVVVFGNIIDGIDIGGNTLDAPGSYLAKYTFEGNVSSVQKISNARAIRILPDGTGNFLVAGDFSDETLAIGNFELENAGGGLSTNDIFVANVSESGQVIDALRVGNSDTEALYWIGFTSQNQLVMSGDYGSFELSLGDITLENELFPGIKGFVAAFDYPLSILELSRPTVMLTVYPNPATDYIQFQSEQIQTGAANIDILDVQGRVVAQENFVLTSNNRLDVSGLENGIYFLSYQLNEMQYTGKFVVNR